MINNFRRLIETIWHCFIAILAIFTINAVFTQTVFSKSLNSSEDIDELDIIVVDKLQADDFINQLPNYDHIEIRQLSSNEAQALLEDNYQLINYSGNLFGFGDFSNKDLIKISCATGSPVGSVLMGGYSIAIAIKTTTKHNVTLAALSVPAGAYFGCWAGLVGGAIALSIINAGGFFYDLFVSDEN